ncbi:MAG TPA: hypothetical protein VG326_01525 [Tepidisphaeraceae bacterium]|jgi:hypothetical protein|nr:hypothetical protein [Tepidisphaeraceae bacterium]
MPDDKALSGPLFAAVGENGLRCFSRDGRAWSNIQLGKEGETYRTAGLGNGRCVAAARFGGKSTFAATQDGIFWKTSDFDSKYSDYVEDVVFFNKRFLAVGGTFFMSSSDGVAWEPRQKLPPRKMSWGMDPTIHRFTVGNGTLVGMADFGVTFTTKDGVEWKTSPNPKASNALIDVAFGNGFFVAGGMHGLCMRSVDGLNWTDRAPGEEGEHINSMTFDGKQFVGIGQGATYISPDGLKWNRVPNNNAPTTATFANGVYVGSLWPGKLMRSTDGIAWEQSIQLPQHVICVEHGVLGTA